VSVDHILYLTPDEEMAGLRQRLLRIQSPAIVVVAPAGAHLLRSIASMQLLRRYAGESGQSVAIVTRDAPTQDMARRQRVPVYPALTRLPARLRGTAGKEELAALPQLPGAPIYRYIVKLGFLGVAAAVLAAGVAAIWALVVLLAPTATVTVQPATAPMSVTMDLLASAQIRVVDTAKGQFPAKPVQVVLEESGTLTTTGSKRAPDAAAAGTVVLANRSQNPLTVPKGTIVRTGTGASIRFATQEEASLAGGAFATTRVPIKAVEPGPNGNVKAGAISIIEGTLSFQVNVLNDEDTSGGSEKQMRYVTLQDRTNLREAIVQKMRASAYAQLRKAIGADDILPEETLSITVNEVVYDHALDAAGETLNGKVRATVSGLFLDRDFLTQIATSRLARNIPGGHVIVPGAIQYSAPANIAFSDGVVTMQMTAVASSQAQISTQDIKRAVAGKPLAEAKSAIIRSFAVAQTPRIDLQNSRLGRLPFLTSRITVTVTP